MTAGEQQHRMRRRRSAGAVVWVAAEAWAEAKGLAVVLVADSRGRSLMTFRPVRTRLNSNGKSKNSRSDSRRWRNENLCHRIL